MERLIGSYSLSSSRSRIQKDHQVWAVDFSPGGLPINGTFTEVRCDGGEVTLYRSLFGELPLYFMADREQVLWHEQKLKLPRGARVVPPGCMVRVLPTGEVQFSAVEYLPVPKIADVLPPFEAATQYWEIFLSAVGRYLNTVGQGKIGVCQSAGVDSCLVTYALLKAGVDVIPLTVCTSADDFDLKNATDALAAMGARKPIPVIVSEETVSKSLLSQARECYERYDDRLNNFKNAVTNILMARKCEELGIVAAFNGHGHDTGHGVSLNAKTVKFKYAASTGGELNELTWQRLRAEAYLKEDVMAMNRNFNNAFRSYGVQVRMPFFDRSVVNWLLSQPMATITPHKKTFEKPYAHEIAKRILPTAHWSGDTYQTTGYAKGAGLLKPRIKALLEQGE